MKRSGITLAGVAPVQQKYLSLEGYTVINPGLQPGDSRRQGQISLEGYTPAKMAACAASSLLQAASSLLRAASPLLRAHLVTSARRFVTYRPRDGIFTARGMACLPPVGR